MSESIVEFKPTKFVRVRRPRFEEVDENDDKYDIPMIDTRNPHEVMNKRHYKDRRYIKVADLDTLKFSASRFRYNADDSADIPISYPSYTKFKIPFDVVCQANYMNSFKKYNNQFRQEIDKLIENQASAREAAYFIRTISYTSLWPPYHSNGELNWTSRNFFRLTEQEKKRFRSIMATDFF